MASPRLWAIAGTALVCALVLLAVAFGGLPDGDDGGLRIRPGGPARTASAASVSSPAPSSSSSVPHVLIVSPMKDSVKHLGRYFTLLRNTSYPRGRLSLGVLDGDSTDKPSASDMSLLPSLYPSLAKDELAGVSGTMARLLVEAVRLRLEGWHEVTVARHDLGFSLSRESRHGMEVQRARRAALSRSRNHALSSSLRDYHEWVLWLDSDLADYPGTALGDLLQAVACAEAAGMKPAPSILVPNVVMSPGGRSYDLNSWRGGGAPGSTATLPEVQKYHDGIDAKECGKAVAGEEGKTTGPVPESVRRACSSGGTASLRLEGYGKTGATYVDKLRQEVRKGDTPAAKCGLARLDGVGGGMLLVRAELHRHGLVFPVAPYRHRAETEGLSMMALDMGEMSWAVPLLEVIHR